MKFTRRHAKALTTEKELSLFDESRAPRLQKHTIAELKQLVKRSRTLRDKLRDVGKSQARLAQRSTRSRGATAPDRSLEKAELFSEVHDIFVARLEMLEQRAAQEKARAAEKKLLASAAKRKRGPKEKDGRSVKSASASKATQNPVVNTMQKPQTAARIPSTKAKIEKNRLSRSGITRKRSHLSSANKRNQAKRDSK